MKVLTALRPSSAEPLELLLAWPTSERRPCGDPRGPRRAGAQPSGRPRWSWRARPRSSASRKGLRAISSRYRPTLSRPSISRPRRCGTCSHVTPSLHPWTPAVVAPTSFVNDAQVTSGFPGQTVGPSAGTTCGEPRSCLDVAALRDFSGLGPPSVVGEPHPVEDPGEGEGPVVPRLVPPGDAAVAGRHLGAQQHVAASAGDRAQPGDPLGRLDVEDPGVVQRGLGQDRRVGALGDVVVRRVRRPCRRRPPGRPPGCPTRRTPSRSAAGSRRAWW